MSPECLQPPGCLDSLEHPSFSETHIRQTVIGSGACQAYLTWGLGRDRIPKDDHHPALSLLGQRQGMSRSELMARAEGHKPAPSSEAIKE
jgi:hypothetical protein